MSILSGVVRAPSAPTLSINPESCLIEQVHLPSLGLVWKRFWFPVGLLLVALFKLWIVRTEEIIGAASQYDALWFVRSGGNWYWNSAYSWVAFARPPAYPLWLALVHSLHVRQRLAIEILQLAGWGVFVFALRRATVPRWLSLVVFAALSLHPFAFRHFDLTLADNFYCAMLPFLLAGLICMVIEPAGSHLAILSGVAFAILWNTREESILLVALALTWLLLWISFVRARRNSWTDTGRQIWKPAVTFGATALVLVIGVCKINQRTFGSFAKSDMVSRNFQSAIHALLRIKPTRTERYVSIAMESYRQAFEISPTFARLRPPLEGPIGESWRVNTAGWTGLKEIGTAVMPWALREAAGQAGVYENPAKAKRFFAKAAAEINQACDRHLVATRPVLGGYLDPLTLEGWKSLPHSVYRVGRAFVKPFEVGPDADESILTPGEKQIYDELTYRRPEPPAPSPALSRRVEVWIARNHRFLIWTLIPCAIAAIPIILAQSYRKALRPDAVSVVIILLGVTVFCRLLLVAVLDATAFWASRDLRYIMPVMPLFTAWAMLAIYQAGRLLAGRATTPS